MKIAGRYFSIRKKAAVTHAIAEECHSRELEFVSIKSFLFNDKVLL